VEQLHQHRERIHKKGKENLQLKKRNDRPKTKLTNVENKADDDDWKRE
jgi:hypothetical protein